MLGLALCLMVVSLITLGAGPVRVVELSGKVVDGETSQPIASASVTVIGPSSIPSQPPVLTDNAGTFRFSALPVGSYSLTVAKAGYIAGGIDQASARDLPASVLLDAGNRTVSVRLWRFASVSGTVRNSSGQPAAGVTVSVLRRRTIAGQVTLSLMRTGRTDYRGDYSISEILPGAYLVATSAALASQAGQIFPAIYYPAAFSPSGAIEVELAPGDQNQPVNFVRVQTPAWPVSGILRTVTGEPLSKFALELWDQESDQAGSELQRLTALTDEQGRFSFPAVARGRYILRGVNYPTWEDDSVGLRRNNRIAPATNATLAVTPRGPTHWVEFAVTVDDRPVTSLSLMTIAGHRVCGKVIFKGQIAPPSPDALVTRPVFLVAQDVRFGNSQPPVARLDPDASFCTVGMPSGRYVLSMLTTFPGWSVLSVGANGTDITGRPFELSSSLSEVVITMTDQASTIAGDVRSSDRNDSASVRVLIFPTDRALWMELRPGLPARIALIRPTGGAGFETSLIPGKYHVVALNAVPVNWRDPAFLSTLISQAFTVDVTPGKPIHLSLRAVKLP